MSNEPAEAARMRRARRELIRAKMTERGIGTGTEIVARDRKGPAPLSSAQQRMWFAQCLRPEDVSYNSTMSLLLDGPLNLDALRGSLRQLVRRHAILRTRYRRDSEGRPIQVLEPEGTAELSLIDLASTDDLLGRPAAGDVPDQPLRRALDTLARESGGQPFDLERDSPLRVTLVRVSDQRQALLVVLHHIAADEVTWRILFADWSAQYAQHIAGAGDLGELPALDYADYAVWEQRRLRDGDLDAQLSYWTEQFTPLPDRVGFPSSAAVRVNGGPTGDRHRLALPVGMVEGLRTVAKSHRATEFMVCLAGFAALLHRYTGATDVVIGIPTVNRLRPETAEVAGNFSNTLAIRLHVTGEQSFSELLHAVRTACVHAYANSEIPFDAVVRRVSPDRDADRSPLFDVMFAHTQSQATWLKFTGLTVSEIPVHDGKSLFDLSVELITEDYGSGAALVATYRLAKYTQESVRQLLTHFVTLLGGVVADPRQEVADLPLSTGEQYRDIIRDGHGVSDSRFPGISPLPQLIARQVDRNPLALAVVGERESLNYRELDRRASVLAGRLSGAGVGVEHIVGIHVERSCALVVALVAVLRTGAAFVPVEPELPVLRIAAVCRAAGVSAVITNRAAAGLPRLAVPVLHVEDQNSEGHAPCPEPALRMDNLAYVVFTSGSTGVPKGVMVSQTGICHRLLWQADLLDFGVGDAALHKSPLGFDMGINEILLPLVCGGRVVLTRPGGESDPEHVLEVMTRGEVTFLDIVPSLLAALLDRPQFDDAARRLRSVWTGGEKLGPELLERFLERCSVPMFHGYGPTEITVACTHTRYRRGSKRRGVTLGRPNANNQVFVLDDRLRPAPRGVAGELYLGGVQVARGYIGAPGLSASRFVADPITGVAGARLYRTGDSARLLPDGTVEFLGRVDNQVKIRGRRIAPEEVENTLTAHPAVRRAVVLAHSDRLVAYCACDSDAPTWPQLRGWLRARLPEHLVPAAATVLDTLPQLPSGKIDRAAVRRIPVETSAARSAYLAPRYAMERALVDLWLELLDVSRIGVGDNFFDLGGHSLLLARTQVLLRERLGLVVPLLELYEHPTVAALATHLNSASHQVPDPETDGGGLVAAHDRARRQRGARAQRLSQHNRRR